MNNNNNTPSVKEVYNPEIFRQKGYKIVDMLANYLEKAVNGKQDYVLPAISPDEMLNKWSGEFPQKPLNNTEDVLNQLFEQSNHLHNPAYIGHQVTAPIPEAALIDTVSSILNNGNAIYEMGPAITIIEKKVIRWMCGLIGYDSTSDGFMTSGGTLGNLTALLAARQVKAGYDVWTEGVNDKLAVLVSSQNHYSIKRAIQVMGLGEKAVFPVETDENYCMTIPAVQKAYDCAIKAGRKVIALVANGGSTATGSYDPLEQMADFCQKHDMWLHVDGAHGGSSLLSGKYRSLLKGIERADSVVWDAHKMMLMPALITGVFFKNGKHSYEAFSQKASYLFEKDHYEEWYNMAQRTMECTKNMMALKLYTSLMTYGTEFFESYIDQVYDLTKKFANMIEDSPDFELAVEPQCNIICFRYIGGDNKNTDENQKRIRKEIVKKGSHYLVQTVLSDKVYLRCTIINPLTNEQVLENLLQKIRAIN